tara:strand:- start:313 stop:693 length:381 start_codon:yes stop_codon:yes gene_type:complete
MKVERVNNFLSTLGLTFLSIFFIVAVIEYLKTRDITQIGAFGFIGATTAIGFKTFQYAYIDYRIKSQTSSFLKHSIIGYGVMFLYSILFYYIVEHTDIKPTHIIYGSIFTMLILWVVYILFLQNLV